MSDLIEEDILKEQKTSQFFSFIGDDIVVQKHLLLYVKYLKKAEVTFAFLKLEKADAATVYKRIMTYMYLRENRYTYDDRISPYCSLGSPSSFPSYYIILGKS